MLVLSRKAEESIRIGTDIEIKVLSIQGNRIRIGINCPAEKRILRGEISTRQDLASIPKYTLETVCTKGSP